MRSWIVVFIVTLTRRKDITNLFSALYGGHFLMINWYLILIPDAPILHCTDVWWHLAVISSKWRRLAVYGSSPHNAPKPRQQDKGLAVHGCIYRWTAVCGSRQQSVTMVSWIAATRRRSPPVPVKYGHAPPITAKNVYKPLNPVPSE